MASLRGRRRITQPVESKSTQGLTTARVVVPSEISAPSMQPLRMLLEARPYPDLVKGDRADELLTPGSLGAKPSAKLGRFVTRHTADPARRSDRRAGPGTSIERA